MAPQAVELSGSWRIACCMVAGSVVPTNNSVGMLACSRGLHRMLQHEHNWRRLWSGPSACTFSRDDREYPNMAPVGWERWVAWGVRGTLTPHDSASAHRAVIVHFLAPAPRRAERSEIAE